MNRQKIILDCDPGIDDALAIMLALSSPELDVLGITTVAGNVPAEMGAQNALRVLQFMNRLDVPVFCGEEKPLVRDYVSAQDTHGEDGLGESHIPAAENASWHPDAVPFLLKTLRETERVSILAIGPLTNLATALRRDREAFSHLDRLVSMGGCYKSFGNCSPVAEYNYWCDPDAARIVYRELKRPIHMLGLDVTRKIVLTPNLLEYMMRLDAEKGAFIRDITRFYLDFHWKQEGLIGCVINDPLAAAYLVNPGLCRGFDAYTDVETDGISIGQTVVDAMGIWGKEPNSHVLVHTDPVAFMCLFIARVFQKLPEEIRPFLEQIMTVKNEEDNVK